MGSDEFDKLIPARYGALEFQFLLEIPQLVVNNQLAEEPSRWQTDKILHLFPGDCDGLEIAVI